MSVLSINTNYQAFSYKPSEKKQQTKNEFRTVVIQNVLQICLYILFIHIDGCFAQEECLSKLMLSGILYINNFVEKKL